MIEFQSRPRQELTVTARQEAQRLTSKLNIKKALSLEMERDDMALIHSPDI
jgi:hypothetical protein